MMWKAAAAFILALGAGGFVAGSVLGDPGGPPDVGNPVVLQGDQTTGPSDGSDSSDRAPNRDDHGRDSNDDLETVYHEPDDLGDHHGEQSDGDHQDDSPDHGSDDSRGYDD